MLNIDHHAKNAKIVEQAFMIDALRITLGQRDEQLAACAAEVEQLRAQNTELAKNQKKPRARKSTAAKPTS